MQSKILALALFALLAATVQDHSFPRLSPCGPAWHMDPVTNNGRSWGCRADALRCSCGGGSPNLLVSPPHHRAGLWFCFFALCARAGSPPQLRAWCRPRFNPPPNLSVPKGLALTLRVRGIDCEHGSLTVRSLRSGGGCWMLQRPLRFFVHDSIQLRGEPLQGGRRL
jgi:hypothetical protein